jgi:steroid delta-isomerase-like uncharacterized protein
MAAEENKAVARRWYEEGMAGSNLAVIDELFTPDFRDHAPQEQTISPGREGFKHFFEGTVASLKDVRVTVEDMITEGDKVVARYTVRGTIEGDFMGIPAAGKTMTITAIDILRFAGGQIAEHWGEADMLGLMQQLGAIPSPAGAAH